MPYSNPSVQDFKDRFDRDFPYGTDMETTVLDSDITKAFAQVNVNINQGLFQDQGSYNIGYLLLSAHYLVTNMRASSQGLNGQFNFLQTGKSVGAVSESFAIPDRILNNPQFSMYSKTNYGAEYLSMIWPCLVGPGFAVRGRTKP